MTCKNYSSTVSKLTDEKVLEMLKNNDYKTCTSNFLRSVLDSKNVSINTKIRSWYEICSNKNLGEVCTSTGLYGPAR